MTPPQPEQPRLRPVEAFPTPSEKGPMVVIRDPAGHADEMLVMSPEAFEILALMDGTRTLEEIEAEVLGRHGHAVAASQLVDMVRTLEERRYLDSPAFAAWRAALESDYLAQPVRAMALAGQAYPAEPEEAGRMIDAILAHDEQAGDVPVRGMCGLVAPHIDLERGATGFATAYSAYARAVPFDSVVVLGTGHYAEHGRFLLSRHGFETPFGIMPLDQSIAETLRRLYPGDLEGDALAHRNEHSIEFQALMLAGVRRHAVQSGPGDGAPSIVPILATSFDDLILSGRAPWESAEVGDFVSALREAVACDGRRVLFLAGADFSHVGVRFGDDDPARGALQEKAEQVDREVLRTIEQGDARALYEAVASGGNATRICSVPSLYTVLAASGAERGRALHYGQALDEDGGAMVSFASVSLYGRPNGGGGRVG